MENQNENENQKPLTLNDLTDYTQKVLLPAFDERLNKLVTKDEFNERLNKLITRNEFNEYNRKVLIPELKELFVTKKEFHEFKDESLINQDAMLKKLDILMEDKEVKQYQDEKKKKFYAIVIKAMKEHNILSSNDLEEIAHLDIF